MGDEKVRDEKFSRRRTANENLSDEKRSRMTEFQLAITSMFFYDLLFVHWVVNFYIRP